MPTSSTAAPASLMPKVRDLAARVPAAELDRCLDEEIATGRNSCVDGLTTEDAGNVLAHAAFVRHQMEDKHMSEQDALRDLARRIRSVVQRSSEPTTPVA